jgi:hypothetical protein
MPKKAAEPPKSEPAKPVVAKTESAEEAGVPIIVRRAIMKDDAATQAPDTTEISKSEDTGNPIEVKSKKSRIEPLTTATEEPKAETAPSAEKPAAPAEPAKPVEPPVPATEPAAPVPTADKPAEAEPKPAGGPEEFTLAGEDSVPTPDDPSQNPIDQAKAKADKEAAEKQAALDKLVDAQTYFLPLNSVEKRRTKQLLFVTLLFLVVLAGAGAFWANGQGYITIPGL